LQFVINVCTFKVLSSGKFVVKQWIKKRNNIIQTVIDVVKGLHVL